MSLAARQKKILISDDLSFDETEVNSSFTELCANSGTLNLAGDVLDDTTLCTDGWRSRVKGLKDWSVSAPAFFDPAETALTIIRDAWLNNNPLIVRYLPDGSSGFHGQVQVENFNLSGDVGSLEGVDISLQADGELKLTNIP